MINVPKDAKIPLIGLVHIGVIDRGTDLLQVRTSTLCNLNCTFCATNHSINRNEFMVSADYTLSWVKEVIKLKQNKVREIHLDSVGEVLTNPEIIDIIKKLKSLPQVKRISMQTNGVLLNKERIKELEKAGLSQINLSIQTLDEKLAKKLSGNENYNLEKILEVAELVAESKIELMIAPVWLPGINDKDIVELIQIAKDLDSKIGIQNYLEYPSSRKIKKIQKLSWFKFYKQLEKWEKEFKIKLKYGPKDFNISKTIRIPVEFKIGERVQAEVISQGWNKDQVIVTAKNRSITVNKCNKKIGDLIKIQVTDNKNSIYLAKPI